MANYASILQWGKIVPGREKVAMQTFLSAVEYFSGLKSKKQIEDLRIYFVEQGNLSDDAGSFIIEGSKEQIEKVVASDEYRNMVVKAYHLCDPLRVSVCATGDEIPNRIQRVNAVRKELGII